MGRATMEASQVALSPSLVWTAEGSLAGSAEMMDVLCVRVEDALLMDRK